ncbi:MAG: GTPase Era [Nitrospira sp.]|nr:GTPase Era [Nitrospira sp.]
MTQPAQAGSTQFRSGMIALAGRPNVGKSTLLNSILQEKIAITSPTPQTTRHRILGVRTLPQAQLVLLDTPGIHKPKYKLNHRMVQVAWESVQGADLILFLVEATAPPGMGDRFILEGIKKVRLPVILVINKMDLIKKAKLLPLMDQYRKEHDFAEIIPISALTGDNIEHLVECLVKYLPEGGPLYSEDTLTDQSMRILASEIVREKILHKTREEIPYAVAVMIEEFRESGHPFDSGGQKNESDKGLTVIKAVILVERDSQKGIIIGEGGRMLKEVGQEARIELETMLGRKVYLELWVKVQENWRQDERVLKELGY